MDTIRVCKERVKHKINDIILQHTTTINCLSVSDHIGARQRSL